MGTNLIRLKKKGINSDGVENWEAHIDPRSVRCIDRTIYNLDLVCEHNLSSRCIARIRKNSTTFRNGTRWAIHYDERTDGRYFEGFGETVGISLEKVKAIMNVVMRRAFENHAFGTFQDGILLKI